MSRQPITISLPTAMAKEVKRVSELENRTTSELVREALHRYFNGIPVVAVSASTLRSIEKGREQVRRGESMSLDEFRYAMASKTGKAGKQKARKYSSKRSK